MSHRLTKRASDQSGRRNARRGRSLVSLVAAAVAGQIAAPAFMGTAGRSAKAADATWNVNAAGNWNLGTNWLPTTPPGDTASTTNPDTATFGTIITAARIVTVDANRNIFGINFAGNGFGYTLSGGNLLLTNGGLIQTSGAGTGTVADIISSPITIQGDPGAATFTGGSTNATHTLSIGNVSGVAIGANTTTLTLNGANTGNNTITGIIANGGTGKLAIVKDGTGTWVLSNTANTFTGGLTIQGGVLKVGSATTALGAAANAVSVTSTGSLDLNGITYTTANALTLNGGSTTLGAITNSSGTAGVYAQGTITLLGDSTVGASAANTLHLGANGAVNTAVISGAFNLTKVGTGTVVLNNTTSTFGGAGKSIFINAGTLQVGHNATAAGSLGNAATAIVLGDTTLGAAATLNISTGGAKNPTYANPITVPSGAGARTISTTSGNATFSSILTLNNNLLLVNTNGTAATLGFSGGTTGTGNISANGSGGASPFSFSGTTAVNHIGSITSTSSNAAGVLTISAPIGTNVTNLVNSGTGAAATLVSSGGITLGGDRTYSTTNAGSITFGNLVGTATTGNTQTLTLSSSGAGGITGNGVIGDGAGLGKLALAVNNTGLGVTTLSNLNTFTGGLTIKSGTVTAVTTGSTATAGPFGGAAGIITLGDSVLNLAATLNANIGGTTVNQISLASSSALLTISNPNTSSVATFSGGVIGTGSLRLAVNGTAGQLSSGAALNFDGNLSNLGTGTGLSTVSANITNLVDNVVQNSATSQFNLSGTNAYTGTTTVTAGTLAFINTASLPGYSPTAPTNNTISVATGATLALGVGAASGQFTSGDVDNIVSGTLPVTFAAGSFLGFDTSTAVGGTATLSSNITNPIGGPSSGVALGIHKVGTGTLVLTGNNTYSGETRVSSGVLRASDGTGLSPNSGLNLNGGVFETGVNFARAAGTTGGTVRLTGGTSGFSANGGNITVAIGTTATPTPLTWGDATFNPASLVLNETTATGTINFLNAINLGTAARTVRSNLAGAATAATLSGQLTSGTGGNLIKDGAGILNVTNTTNSYSGGTTVSAGTLSFNGGGAGPGGMPLPSGTVNVNAGTLQILNDTAGVLAYGNAVTLGGTQAITVGNNGAATTGSTVAFGSLSAPATSTNTGTTTTFSSPNGYSVRFTSLALPGTSGATTTLVANTDVVINGNVTNRMSGTITTGNFDTIALQGTATGSAITGVIADGASRTIAIGGHTIVTKTGTGTWTLSGANTYTGGTNANGGNLVLSGATTADVIGGSLVTVNAAGILTASGNVNIGTGSSTLQATQGTVNVVGGTTPATQGTLSLNDGAINILNIKGNANAGAVNFLTLGTTGTGTAAALNFDVGETTTDQILLTPSGISGSGKLSLTSGGAIINVTQLASMTLDPATYSLLTFAAGSTLTGAFSLGTTNPAPGTIYSLQLNGPAATATALQLVVSASAGSSNVFWTGSQNTVWNTNPGGPTNWANAFTSGANSGLPDAATNVFFTASSAANLNTTLGQAFTINSLSFTGSGTAAASSVTIGGANPLTLTPAAGFTDQNSVAYTSGTGLVVQSGSFAHTISAPVVLGANQSWQIDNAPANALTVSGAISGASRSLTKTGPGTLILGGANTFGGGLTIANGTVVANVSNATTVSGAAGPSASTITLGGAGNSASLLANTFTVSNPITLGSPGAGTLTLGNNGGATNATFSGAINLNGQNLTLASTGTGTTTIGTGAISGNGTITNNGGGSGTTTISGAVGSGVNTITQSSTTSALTVSGGLTVGTTTTLVNTLGTKALTVSGAIGGTGNLVLNNNSTMVAGISLGAVNNVGSITNSGTGVGGTSAITGIIGTSVNGIYQSSAVSDLTLSGANTFNNAVNGITITAGKVNFGADNNLGATAAVINLNGGTLNSTYAGTGLTITHPIVVGASGGTLSTLGATASVNGKLVFGTLNQLTGSGTFTKTGGGDLQISQSQSFSGQFNVNGLVEASANGALGTGPVHVNAELAIANAVSLTNAFTFNTGAIINAQGGTTPGTMTIPATATIAAAGDFKLATRDFNTFTSEHNITVAANIISGSGDLSFIVSTETTSNNQLVILSGDNSGWSGDIHTSAATATNGIRLRVGSPTALGNSTGVTNIGPFVALDLNATTYGVNETLNLTGTGPTNFPTTLTNQAAGAASFGGPINLLSDIVVGSTAGGNVTLSGNIDGAFKITKIAGSTASTYVFSGTNTFSGGVVHSAGTIGIGSNTALGTGPLTINVAGAAIQASGGARTITNAVLVNASGAISGTNALTLGGSMTGVTSGRTITVTNTGGTEISGNVYLSDTAATGKTLIFDIPTANPNVALTLSGAISDFNGVFTGTGSGITIQPNAAGSSITVSGNNTYTGTTSLGGAALGTVIIGSDTAFGTSAVNLNTTNLQAGGAARTIANTVTNANATANVVGSNNLTFSGTYTASSGGNRAINNNSTGLLTFSGAAVNLSEAGQTRTSTFGGTGNIAISAPIVAGGTGGNLTKAGTGTLTLTGTNTYTGATAVNAGVLKFSAGTLANTAITVNPVASGSPATFAALPGSGSLTAGNTGTVGAGASLTIKEGTTANPIPGAFTMVDNAIGTFNLVQEATFATGLTVGGATATGYVKPTLSFELGDSADEIDLLTVTKAASIGTGGAELFFSPLSSATSLTPDDYTFLTASAGLGASLFTLGNSTISLGDFTYSLSLTNSTATSMVLTVAQLDNNAASFWTGSQDNSWSTNNAGLTNFATSPSGATNTGAVPDANSNVTLTANTAANLATQLDEDFTINSLTFSGAGTANTAGSSIASGVNGTKTLTINATSANGNVAGEGINVLAGSGPNAISANVALGASQSWTIDTDTVPGVPSLVVSGNVSGAFALTKAGAGTLTLSGANNTYSGGTILNLGKLNVNSATALGTGRLTLTLGTLDNTSGGSITHANDVVQTWSTGGIIAFTGANALNLGTGAVSLGTDATAGSFTLTNNSTLPGTSLTVGGLITSATGGTAAGKTLTIGGPGSTALTGGMNKGTATSLVLNVTSSGTLTLPGVNVVNLLNINGGASSIIDLTATGKLTVDNGAGTDGIQSTTGGTINNGEFILTRSDVDNGTNPGTTLTINSKVTGAFRFEAWDNGGSTGIVVLNNNANDFSGGVLISGNFLSAPSFGTTGSASALGTGSTVTFGNGASTIGIIYTGTGGGTEVTNKTFALTGTTGTVSFEQAGTKNLQMAGAFNLTAAGARTINFKGDGTGTAELIAGVPNGLTSTVVTVTKTGTGTWSLSGDNTYTGTTTVSGGRLALNGTNLSPSGSVTTGGTLALGADNRLPATFSLAIGGANSFGTLDMTNGSQTLAGLTFIPNSTTASTITVGPGKTLTLNNGLAIGTNVAPNSVSTLNIGGGGAFNMTTAAGGVLQIGGNTAANSQAATLDLTGLASTNLNTSITGTIRVNNNTGTNTAGNTGTLLLPIPTTGITPTTPVTTITAANFNIGDGGGLGNGPGQINSVVLGTGRTTLNADTVNVGTGLRDLGSLTFASGNGTIKLRAADGAGRATVNIGVAATTTGVAPGTGTTGSIIDFNGHDADLLISTLNVGNQARITNLTTDFKFDTGTLDATGVTIGFDNLANGNGAVTLTHTLAIGGGTVEIGTGGVDMGHVTDTSTGAKSVVGNFNVSGGDVHIGNNTVGTPFSVRLGRVTSTSVITATDTFAVSGGTTRLEGDIITASSVRTTSTLALSGGLLNMQTHNIGNITNVNFTGGTLRNLGTMNRALAQTASGVDSLLDVATNPATINGAYSLTGSGSNIARANIATGQSLTVAAGVTVNSLGEIGGGGTIAGPITLAGGTVAPGSSAGTLTSTGNQTWGAGSTYEWEISDPNGAQGALAGWDLVEIGGTLALPTGDASPDIVIDVNRIGGVLTAGAIDPEKWFTIVHAAAITGYSEDDFVLPDLVGPDQWEIQEIANPGVGGGRVIQISAIPEPSALSLLGVGAVGLLRRRRRTKR